MNRQSRRAAVLLAALALPGLILLGIGRSESAGEQTSPKNLTREALAKAELFAIEPEPWADPPEASWQGPKPYPLVVRYGSNTVRVGKDGKPQKVSLRSYNGGLVGPTFRLKPGDTLKLDLDNQLPDVGGSGGHHGEMDHPLNWTNLHTHGLHISPRDKSDNVERKVKPTEKADYEFQILPAGNPRGEPPMAHYPGTFWYHAHLHGTTAAQLASGMAGALIVEGDIDQIPEIKNARERIFIFQQLAFDKDGEVKSLDDLDGNWAGDDPDDPPKHGPEKHTTINGKVKPLIELRPSQVERWRLIDAGVFEMLNLSLRDQANPQQPIPFHAIAFDGITLKAVQELKEIELAPGYRADVLVQAPKAPGTYLLYKRAPNLRLTALTLTGEDAARVDEPAILAVLKVAGEPCTSPRNPCASKLLPAGTKLPAPLPDIPESVTLPVRTVEFSVGPKGFLINGRLFDPDKVDRDFQLTKGATEEWILTNTSKGPHPFHIHVNAFQMVNNGQAGEWRDTIIVPPAKSGQPGKVRFRTRIERFTGRFVLHCHILTHEDRGMMQLVEVKDPWAQAVSAGRQQ
jgi:FtsP/CotA-like multicopper oxidase with cupredoxin domain